MTMSYYEYLYNIEDNPVICSDCFCTLRLEEQKQGFGLCQHCSDERWEIVEAEKQGFSIKRES